MKFYPPHYLLALSLCMLATWFFGETSPQTLPFILVGLSLIGFGFLTNKIEGAYLNSKKGQNEMSEAIAKAIVSYKNLLQSDLQEDVVFEDLSSNTEKNNFELEYIFRVQISASKTMLEPKSFNFKGLSPIKRIKTGSLYKYFLGNATSYEKAKELKQLATEKGYNGSFVVAFMGEEIVPLNNALKRN